MMNDRLAQPGDKREEYYRDRVRQHGQRYQQFHLPSVQVVLDLVYTYDVAVTRLTHAISEHELSLSAFNVLMILSRSVDKQCPLYEIGELLLVSRANVTGLVDCLERKGLVERLVDENDRRVRMASITGAGEALLRSLLPRHYSELKRICSRLSNTEKSTLSSLLTKLRHSMQSSPEGKRLRKKTKKGELSNG
jgi:MarR family 2-MHQ and catechol resistance regulon transcriptional repressor